MHCVSLFYQNIITLVEFVFNLLLSAVCFFVTFRVRFACCFLSLTVNKIHYHHHHHHHHHQRIVIVADRLASQRARFLAEETGFQGCVGP